MIEFYEGTLDTLMERLCNSISSFDQEWVKRCVPATEGQIQQLQDILAEYHYTIPAAYLSFLRRMGQDDGGLLENEWDDCEADIGTVLEVLEDREDLEKGFFLFSSNWDYALFYMNLSSMDDNPVITGIAGSYDAKSLMFPDVAVCSWNGITCTYIAESFEKYLFQRAFHMYQRGFAHRALQHLAYHEKKEKEDCRMCPLYENTAEKHMDYIIRMADTYDFKKAWFSDRTHFFYYCSNYAFEISVSDYEYVVNFSCDDDKLFDQVRDSFFPKFFMILCLWRL